MGPWKLLHRPLSCLRPLHASRRPPRSRDAPVLGLGVHNARAAIVSETCTLRSLDESKRLAGPPRGCFPQPQAVRPTQISCYLTSFRPDIKRLPTPWTSRSLHRLLRSASRRDVLWVIPMCLWRSSELSGCACRLRGSTRFTWISRYPLLLIYCFSLRKLFVTTCGANS